MLKRITDLGKLIQQVFADTANAIKVAQAGLDLSPLGAIGSALQVDQNQPYLVFNSTGTIAYVAFGAQTMAAPTGPTDGIPVLPNSTIVVNSGNNRWIRASAATVYAYGADNQ